MALSQFLSMPKRDGNRTRRGSCLPSSAARTKPTLSTTPSSWSATEPTMDKTIGDDSPHPLRFGLTRGHWGWYPRHPFYLEGSAHLHQCPLESVASCPRHCMLTCGCTFRRLITMTQDGAEQLEHRLGWGLLFDSVLIANQHVFILQRRSAIIITRACIHFFCGLTFVPTNTYSFFSEDLPLL